QHELASRRTTPLYRHIRHQPSPVKPAVAGLSAWRVARHTRRCYAGSRMIPVHFAAEEAGLQVQGKEIGVSVNVDVSIWGGESVDLRIGGTAHCTTTVCTVKDSQCVPEERA